MTSPDARATTLVDAVDVATVRRAHDDAVDAVDVATVVRTPGGDDDEVEVRDGGVGGSPRAPGRVRLP